MMMVTSPVAWTQTTTTNATGAAVCGPLRIERFHSCLVRMVKMRKVVMVTGAIRGVTSSVAAAARRRWRRLLARHVLANDRVDAVRRGIVVVVHFLFFQCLGSLTAQQCFNLIVLKCIQVAVVRQLRHLAIVGPVTR